jgi:hypothetical protein
VDFIMMLTRQDRTVEDAESVVDEVLAAGVRHVGFKDIGVPKATMRRVLDKIRAAGAMSYLEVVSTTQEAVLVSLATGHELGFDRILGGTDLDAASRILGDLRIYHPFPGRPVGHPTNLEGDAAMISAHCRTAILRGCGGVDLLAYRATQADPLDLGRAARAALGGARLIIAGSVKSREQIRALAEAGADAFTIGSAIFDGSFAPTKGGLAASLRDVLDACT